MKLYAVEYTSTTTGKKHLTTHGGGTGSTVCLYDDLDTAIALQKKYKAYEVESEILELDFGEVKVIRKA